MKWIGIFCIRAIGWVLGKMSPLIIRRLGCRFGLLLYAFGFRTHIVYENLQLAFPDLSDEQRRSLEREHFKNFGCLLIEFLRSFAPNYRECLENECTFEGEENIRAAEAEGKGVLVITAHLGNWEVFSAYGCGIVGLDVTMVTKRIRPNWFQDFVEQTRLSFNTKMAFEPRTMQQVISTIRRKAIVGFAIDQFAGAPVGARVPFFGKPVGTHTVVAVLAQRFGCPVVPGYTVRRPNGGFHVVFEPALPYEAAPDPNAENARELEIIRNTAAYNRKVEAWVRRFPDQWLWIHRRWKGDLSPLPAGSPGEMMRPD